MYQTMGFSIKEKEELEPEFYNNPENRCPVILLLDNSSSMSGQPIDELNEGLKQFKASVMEDNLARLRVEVSIITFGDPVQVIQDFITVDEFKPPQLQTNGSTPMGQGIETALDSLLKRKAIYRAHGIQYYRPWIFLITDGAPTDNWENAAQRLKDAEANRKLLFFAVGVQGANMATLKQLCLERPPLLLNGLNFQGLFKWLSASLQQTSHSRPGDCLPLPPVNWGSIDS